MSPSHHRIRVVGLIGLAVLGGRCVLACGPFFPNQLLFSGDTGVLSLPQGDFNYELTSLNARAKPAGLKFVVPPSGQDVYGQSAAADVADLRQALAAAGTDERVGERLVRQYQAFRGALAGYCREMEGWRAAGAYRPSARAEPRPVLHVQVPGGLPGEFADYASGLVAFHEGRLDDARGAWRRVLDRPAAERRYRSTWAAYMLGKSTLERDPVRAARYFEMTRALAAGGFSDSLGLAASSIGWQGRAELNRKRYREALLLYMAEYATGSPTAETSLLWTVDAAFAAGREAVESLAGDAACRRVVAAYLVAGQKYTLPSRAAQPDGADWRGGAVDAWAAALDAQHVQGAEGADRLAWAAYMTGRYPLAQRFADRGRADAPMILWVRAKLLLRAGKLEEAAPLLARAAAAFPVAERWPSHDSELDEVQVPARSAMGDLGVLRLTRGQYVDALDLLIKADAWTDAAYVAERVLTVDELKAYVDRRHPEPAARPEDAAPSMSGRVRYLLARRLTRGGRWKEARPYYPPAFRPVLDQYIEGVRAGCDEAKPASVRAAAFWQAAQVAHDQGMELMGTELSPDYLIYDGRYQYPPLNRSAGTKVIAPTADELARLARSAPTPDVRFHYRCIAADHAFASAELMPDDTDRKAEVLQTAGLWLAAREPKLADRFYKALVRTCPHTALGRRAAARHWFAPTGDGDAR
jgi:hypothetical protein